MIEAMGKERTSNTMGNVQTTTTNGKQKFHYEDVMSPIVKMKYIHLDKPDVWNNQETSYCTTLIFDPKNNPDDCAFLERLQQLSEKAKERMLQTIPPAKKRDIRLLVPFKDDADKEGNLTGLVIMKVSTKNAFGMFDAQKKPLSKKDVADLRWGTTGRCKISLKDAYIAASGKAGVVAYLSAIQIVEPVMTGGNSDGSNDFDVVETKGNTASYGNNKASSGSATHASASADTSTSGDGADDIPF